MSEFFESFLWLLLEYKEKEGRANKREKEILEEMRVNWNLEKVDAFFEKTVLDYNGKLS